MVMPLELEIRSHLARYLAGEQTLSEFVSWFSPNTWNIQQSGNPKVAELAYAIDLLLSEYSDGGWTEEQLRAQLRPFAEDYSVSLSYGDAPLITTTTSTLTVVQTINWHQATQSKSVGKELEWVFA